MAGFYIEKITANSIEKGDVSVSFCKGLNIIQGRSDSGKTCVANCINYAFGGSAKPFDDSFKYDGVTILIKPNDCDGELTISRRLGKNQVEVVSSIHGITSGKYYIKPPKDPGKLFLNDVWLALMGIPTDTRINKNASFEKCRLTWKTLLRIFYIDENKIDDSDSIVEPKHRYLENTLFLSSFLYLLTGKSFSETDAKEKAAIKAVRQKALKNYVNSKVQDIAVKKEELEKKLSLINSDDIEYQIEVLSNELQEIQQQIDNNISQSRSILDSIVDANERRAECDMLLGRFKQLSTQYTADIRRLSFIVEGEKAYKDAPRLLKCPYCDGEMNSTTSQSYTKSSRVELERIIAQLSGLKETEQDVLEQIDSIDSELAELTKRRDELEKKVKEEMRPIELEQRKKIEDYKIYLKLKSEVEFIETFSQELDSDLLNIENELKDDKKDDFHPKDYFGDDFVSTMTDYAYTILKECNYSGLCDAKFDFNLFDIEVNGAPKGTSHGKGYRSYLNTVMIMMVRKYLAAHAKYNPGVFIIDTPLHGFDDGIDEKMPKSMRTGLYSYFMNHQEESQLIIIENLDHIPNLDYEKHGACVETFVKQDIPGKKYGFLNDIR